MQTVGEILKNQRKARNISLKQVFQFTKLSPQYVKCIENDNYNPLPEGPYVEGYLSTYAQFLEIDANEIIEQYRYQNRDRRVSHIQDEPIKVQPKKKRVLSKKSWSLLVFFALIFTALSFFSILWHRNETPQGVSKPQKGVEKGVKTASSLTVENDSAPIKPKQDQIAPGDGPDLLKATERVHPQPPADPAPETDPKQPVTELVVVTAGPEDETEYVRSQAEAGIEILQTNACTSVEGRNPVGAGDSFPWSIPKIYIWNKLKIANPPVLIRHIYYFENRKVSEIELTIPASMWRTWSFKTIANEKLVGSWRIDITAENGNVLTSVAFQIH